MALLYKLLKGAVLRKQNVFRKDGKALVSRVAASADIKKSVKKAVDLIGGFEKVISSGDRVVVNLSIGPT